MADGAPGFSPSAADIRFLTSAAGRDAVAIADRLALTDRSLVADVAAVRREVGGFAPAVIEQVRCRRKAAGKLNDPQSWLLTAEALQQATPTAVARHRAQRLTGLTVHDVTCSVGTELRALRETSARVIGSDLSRTRAALARVNEPFAGVHVADALMPATRGVDAVIADPARRAGGRRTFDPAKTQPPLPELVRFYRHGDGAPASLAVKSAPGIDYAALRAEWAIDEVEIVSLDGSVREACLWWGEVATAGLTSAAVLRTDGGGYTVRSDEPDDVPAGPAGRFVIDPDGAVVRAGLVRHYAARHGLWQLDPRIAYLTGDSVPPGTRGFEVLAEGKFTEKAVRAQLTSFAPSSLEILARGVPVDPDALRNRLKLKPAAVSGVEGQHLSLVITRIGATPWAYVCRATSVGRATSVER